MHPTPQPQNRRARQLSLFPQERAVTAQAERCFQGWCLAVTGEALGVWAPLVVEAVRERYRNPRTAEKAAADTAHLFCYLEARGARSWADVDAGVVSEWCWAAHRDRSGHHRRTAQSTARNRRWTALAAFEEAARLGAPIDPWALAGERIARPVGFVSARPLTDEEAHRVRVFADCGGVASRRSLLVAFSFAGGSATEVAAVRTTDVDLAAAAVAFSGPAARDGLLDGWGVETVERYFRNNPPAADEDLLCVTSAVRPDRAAHSVSVRLGRVLRDAGLSGRPGVSARSIRLTAAHRILLADGIEAAARFLGSPSLDSTAAALNYDWKQRGV